MKILFGGPHECSIFLSFLQVALELLSVAIRKNMGPYKMIYTE